MDMDLKVRIVEAARRRIGTPFQHQGRLKANDARNGRCDCLGLLVGVADELELVTHKTPMGDTLPHARKLSAFDETDYGIIPDAMHLKMMMDGLLKPIAAEEIQAGDVLLMRVDGAAQHVAIVSDYHGGGLGIIHALATARKVVEHALDVMWKKRIVQAYRLDNPAA